MCRKSDLGYTSTPLVGLNHQIYEQLSENLYYYDVPNSYHARIVSTDEQKIVLAKDMLNCGKRIEEVIEKTGVIQIGPYSMMTRESIQQERERLFEKARHDEAQALHHAKQKAKIEIARNLLKMGLSFDQITQATDLTQRELGGSEIVLYDSLCAASNC